MENPAMYMMKNVATSEMGISIKGRIAISQSRKKKKITSTTNPKEMNKVSFTSLIDFRMFTVLSRQHIHYNI